MNILNIIKKAPKDHVYYCTIIGECRCKLEENNLRYPIRCFVAGMNDYDKGVSLTNDGKLYTFEEYFGSECVLFPSRDNRDWEAFERELDGKQEEKKPLFHSESESFDGSVKMVSIPDRPMMAAVIMSGLLARGSKDKGATLVNKAVNYADMILDYTKGCMTD